MSLRYIAEACQGQIAFDLLSIENLIQDLELGSAAPPSTFADYYDLVSAIDRGDELEAERLLRAIGASPVMTDCASSACEIIPLSDDPSCQRYQRMFDEENDGIAALLPPRAEAASQFRDRLVSGFALLDLVIPDLAEEIRGLVRQIILVGADPQSRYQIDGGSHYQLWGALFLNVDFHHSDIAIAEVLAHETGHSLLFGLCIDSPLVENDALERFPSPLRSDPRPMDGIFHATYVSARMHWTMSRLARCRHLSLQQRDRARQAALSDEKNFRDGITIVRCHGKLTPLGKDVMDSAEAYMCGVQTQLEPGLS